MDCGNAAHCSVLYSMLYLACFPKLLAKNWEFWHHFSILAKCIGVNREGKLKVFFVVFKNPVGFKARFTPLCVAADVGITSVPTPATTRSQIVLLLGDAWGCHSFLMAPLQISAYSASAGAEPQGKSKRRFPCGRVFEKEHTLFFFAETQAQQPIHLNALPCPRKRGLHKTWICEPRVYVS